MAAGVTLRKEALAQFRAYLDHSVGPEVEASRRADAILIDGALTALLSSNHVLVIGPPEADAQTFTDDALDNLLREQLRDHSVKDAVALASELSGRPRREVYARALELAKEVKGNGED